MSKSPITPLIFIFITYYYLAKNPILKAKFMYVYNFCDFAFFYIYCIF